MNYILSVVTLKVMLTHFVTLKNRMDEHNIESLIEVDDYLPVHQINRQWLININGSLY